MCCSHILPDPGKVLPLIRDAKHWCSLKFDERMKKKTHSLFRSNLKNPLGLESEIKPM